MQGANGQPNRNTNTSEGEERVAGGKHMGVFGGGLTT